MFFMMGKSRAQSAFAENVLDLTKNLKARYSSTEETGHVFIHPDETEQIITPKRIHDLFGHHSWFENNHVDLWRHMRLIICTLVVSGWTKWDDWEHFKRLFFNGSVKVKNARLTDKDLPMTLSDFEQPPHGLLDAFQRDQYIFAPILIHQGSHCQYSKQHRLPILKVEDADAKGAQGVVEKVTIEARFLAYANRSSNSRPQVMAYKRIQANTDDGKRDFKTEQRALEQCRASLSQNSNIMLSFATFLHGSHLVILTPWAHGRDLNRFLRQPDSVLLDDYNNFSYRFSPDNLLTEAYNLARALHFLHFQLVNPRGRSIRCAHLDLKPENVLVEWLPEERDMPVGRWKISDFGLSNVEEAVTENQIMPVGRDEQEASKAPGNIAGELSFQPRVRGPGPFQPPEVHDQRTAKVSTKRDVWSYGCILMMVLAFAVGGPQEVEEQRRRRAVGGDDYFYRRTGGRRSRAAGTRPDTEAEIKHGIRNWMKETRDGREEHHVQWISTCIDLISRLLNVDVIARPEINDACRSLDVITTLTETYARDRLWDFEEQRRPSRAAAEITQAVSEMAIPSRNRPEPLQTPPSTPNRATPPSPIPATIYQSPASNRSSTSRFSRSSAQDPSLQYGKLEAPRQHSKSGAVLDPAGRCAALWSPRDLHIYALEDELRLHGTIPDQLLELDASCKASIHFPEPTECVKVSVSGQWFAVVSMVRDTQYVVTTYYRPSPKLASSKQRTKINLGRNPQGIVISSQGDMALHYPEKILLYLGSQSTSLPRGKDFVGMAFTGDGDKFCLWERDIRFHYWTVWNTADGATLGNTISKDFKWDHHTQGNKPLLLPFTSWPRFIAYDHQQELYLIRADAESARVHGIGAAANVVMGTMLPDDEAFVVVQTVAEKRAPVVTKGSLSFVDEPSAHLMRWGKLSRQFEPKYDAVATSSSCGESGETHLLVLSRTGLLVAKTL